MTSTNFKNKYCKNGHLLERTHRTFKRKTGTICNRCSKCDEIARHKKNKKLKKAGVFTEYNRKFQLWAKYKITVEQFNELFKKQKYSCGCCKTKDHGHYNWIVDHDHKTKKVRGILCKACNSGIGFLGDDFSGVKAALKYLKRAK